LHMQRNRKQPRNMLRCKSRSRCSDAGAQPRRASQCQVSVCNMRRN
jgi:hypothetical protein